MKSSLTTEDFITIEFSYNGDLGVLQHKTRANRDTALALYENEIITYEEYMEAIKKIRSYFTEQLKKVLKQAPLYV